jgi:phytanoyl-CoA hydroxylase
MNTGIYLNSLPWIDNDSVDIESKLHVDGVPASATIVEKLYQWRSDGIVVFKDVVDTDVISSFVEELDSVFSSPHDYQLSIEIKGERTWTRSVRRDVLAGPGVKINHLHNASLNAAKLSLTREVTEFLSIVFTSPAVPLQSLTFRFGSQQPTHIDYPYVRQQKRLGYLAASWIPLENVCVDAGPLAYFPGGHKPTVSGFFDWGAGDILARPETQIRTGMDFAEYLNLQMKKAGIRPVVFLPKKGDVLLWHANMPHLGLPVASQDVTRKSLVTHYTGFSDYPATWLTDDILKSAIRLDNGIVFDFPWNKPDGRLPSW